MQTKLNNAYLIIAHNNWEQVRLLIRLLDCKYNDIFIHVNSHVEMPDQNSLIECANESKVFFSKRTKVVWGEYGIFAATILLLKKARENRIYDYYHLMTGSDLPLQSNSVIQKFLQDNLYNNSSSEKLRSNFLGGGYLQDSKMCARITQYNLCVPLWKHKYPFVEFLARKTNRAGYYIQKLFRVNRLKKVDIKLAHGSSWWMISDELAGYILDKEEWIKRYFSMHTFSADEFIVQTLALNSMFKDSVYKPQKGKRGEANMWEIDWKRGDGKGSPHIFTIEDKDMLLQSPNIYGRKFDIRVDREIVDIIIQKIRPELINEMTGEAVV